MINTPLYKRLLYLSQHRGMAELDLLLGNFASLYMPLLSPSELQDFEALMEAYDGDILTWLTHKDSLPDAYNTPLFHKLMQYTHHEHALALSA